MSTLLRKFAGTKSCASCKRTDCRACDNFLTDIAAFDEIEVLYRNAPLGIALFTRDCRWVRINPQLAEINGFPVEAHIGASIDDLLPDLAEGLRQLWRPVFERGESIENIIVEGETPARPGEVRSWLNSYYPVRSASGEVTGLLALVSEQTALLQRQRDISQLEAQLELALSASGIDIWSWNLSKGELQRSPRSLLALGFTEAQSADLEFVESRIHPDHRKRIDAAYQAHLKGHSPEIDVEYRLRDMNDRWIWFRMRGKALATDTSRRDFVVAGTYENIDDAKMDRQDRELLRSLRLRLSYLHTADEMKEVTCAMIGRRLSADYVSYVSVDRRNQNVRLDPFWSTGKLPPCFPGFIIEDLPPPIRDSVFQGRPFIAGDLASASPFPKHGGASMLAERGVQSMMIVPQMHDLRMVAALVVQQAEPFHWLERERTFVANALTALWDAAGRAFAESDAENAKALVRHAGQLGGTAVFDFDYDADSMFVSPEFAGITGCDPVDANADPFESYVASIHPDDLAAFEQERARASNPQGDGLCLHDHRIVHGDGDIRWVQFRGQNMFSSNGQVRRWMGAIHEVTELRLADAKAIDFDQRYRLAGMVSFDTIWDADKETHQCLWSPSISTAFGYRPLDGLTSLDWRLKRVHSDERAMVQESYTLAKASGQDSWTMEYRFKKEDGTYTHVIDRCQFIRNKDGSVRRAVGILHDTSERRATLARVQQQQRELERVSRLGAMGAMGAMASTLAHELNQPLTAASNYMSVISSIAGKGAVDSDVAANMSTAAGKAVEQVQRAGAIIRKMRDFTLTGEITVERANFVDVLHRTIDRITSHPAAGKVTIAQSIPRKAIIVLLDPVQIEQVITNLLTNAVEALQDTHSPTISTEVTTSNGKLFLTVLDNGPGLSDETLREIFLPFKSSKKSGMGLGLPICRTIVEAHGGHLIAEQRVEGGASFTMSLPLADGLME
ncbi:PAS domain S-box protein [Chakrabartia godavariana]|nr:PAS domain S-box protein [Chakrabartia godavariana]